MQNQGKFILLLTLAFFIIRQGCAQTADDLSLSYTNQGSTVYDDFLICNDGEPPFRFVLRNETTHTGFTAFKIKQGDEEGTVVDMAKQGKTAQLSYQHTGTFQMEFIGITASGAEISKMFTLKIVGKPNATLSKQNELVKCLGTDVHYTIEVTSGNTNKTVYFLSYDDGTEQDRLEAAELKNGKGTFVHKYMQSYCDIEDHVNDFFKVTLNFENECYSGELTTQSEYVAVPFDAQYTFDQLGSSKVCTYEKVKLRNLTGGGKGSDCRITNPIAFWSFGNGEESYEWEPEIWFEDARKYNIKLVVSNNYACATDSVEHPVELINRTKAIMEVAQDTVCVGQVLKFKNRSSGDEITSRWTVVPLDGGTLPEYNEYDVHPEIKFEHWGKYKVTLYVSNVCSADETDTIIVVKQNPELVRYDLPADICLPEYLDMSRYMSVMWNGNPEGAQWTITRDGAEANTGFDFISGNLTSAFPVVKFNTAGTYTVSVGLKDIGCDKIKLTDSRQVVVHDPAIIIDIDTTALNICEKGVVSFTNHSVGEELRYEWSVKPFSNVEFLHTTGKESASPVMQFNKYGDYEVSLRTYTRSGCGSVDTTYRIHVRKDPSIFFFEPPEAVCPGASFILPFEGLVEYRFYNNAEQVKWTVNPDDGGCEFKDGTDVTTPKPVIQFNNPGSYTFTVEVASAGCPETGTDQVLTRSVWVRTGTMKLEDAKASDTLVCEGEDLLFSINAVNNDQDPLIYSWSVSPTDGSYEFKDYGNDKKIARLAFKQWGHYEVRGIASGFCGSLDTVFQVTVEKDPEVRLRDTAGLCPGVADMLDYATYAWYNNKKEVNWKVTRIGADADSGYDIDDVHAEYPKIHFKEAGEYRVQVEAVSHTQGCAGDALTDAKTFRIYVPEIIGDIVMTGVDAVGDPSDICEGESVGFNNTTNSEGGISWQWKVEGPEEGYVFSHGGKTSDEQNPVITFTLYGDYTVHVKVLGTCEQKEYSFPVKVRGVPQVLLENRLSRICEGDQVDMREHLVYPDVAGGNKNQNDILTYHWSVLPDAVVTQPALIGTPDTDFTTVTFPEHAHYTIRLEVGMKCVENGKLVLESGIDVIANALKAAFTVGKDSVGCTNGSEIYEVVLQNQSVGDSLTYQWEVVTVDGDWQWTGGDAHTESPRIKINREGSYQVTLKAAGCRRDDTTFVLKAFAVPEVRIDDIAGVCEAYDFLGKTGNLIQINEHNDPIDSVKWKFAALSADLAGSYEFIHHTGDTSCYPDIRFNACDYTVSVEYWNRCQTPGRDTFRIQVDRFIPIASLMADSVCSQSQTHRLLRAEPDTGVWKLKDALQDADRILYRKEGKYYFNPLFGAHEERDVELVYTLQNLSCKDEKTMKMHVWPLPFTEAGGDRSMCLNESAVLLVGQDSVGGGNWQANRGNWKLNGEILSGHFFQADSAGDFALRYEFADGHGCENADSAVMTVYPLPDTAFLSREQYCRGAEAEFIVNSHENRYIWKYFEGAAGDTLTGNGKHIYEVPGYYGVTLIAESVNGCLDTSSVHPVEIVNDAPPAVFTMSKHADCGPEVRIELGVNEADYSDHNLKFVWDYGNGTTSGDLLPVTPQIYSSGVNDTLYYLDFRVYNICNETRMTDTLLVGSVPEAGFHFENGERNCSPLHLQVINSSTGSGNRYTWYMGDGKDPLEVFEPKDYLYETGSKTQIFPVSLVAENNCGKDSIMQPLTVFAQTLEAFFDKPKDDICVGEEICFTNYSQDTSRYITYKYWDFGDQVRDTSWNVCHVYQDSGTYQVMLYIDNGCTFDTLSKFIHVTALPELKLTLDEVVCDEDTVNFAFVSDQDLRWYQWTLGDGATVQMPAFPHVYARAGTFPVTLEAIAANRAACKGQEQRLVTVHPRPEVRITPWDTLVCPPWNYIPQVEGVAASWMWDYGDGSELTTAAEHLYENSTDSVLRHQVVLHAVSDKGCPKDFTGEIAVAYLPVAEVKQEVTTGRPEKLALINLSRNYSEAIWYLPPGRVEYSFDNQYLEFEENGIYPISLVTVNEYGCRDSLAIEHEVLLKGLYFPNTFIPHSLNGKVNRFNGIGMGLQRYKLEIFDFYNNKIWETRALQDGKPSEGWDGCNVKGERMPQGVYTWRAEAIFGNDDVWTGKNNESGVPQTTQGTVLLLRE